MMKRRYEVRTFEHLGEIIEYTVVVVDRPAPIEENPYVEGGRCLPEPHDARTDQGGSSGHPRPAGPVCLTKRQFVQAFQRSLEADGRSLPASCERRREVARGRVESIRHAFAACQGRIPRRLCRALDTYRWEDLAFAYDRGWAGRLGHYFRDHVERRRARERRLLARWAAEEGVLEPGSIAAGLASSPLA